MPNVINDVMFIVLKCLPYQCNVLLIDYCDFMSCTTLTLFQSTMVSSLLLFMMISYCSSEPIVIFKNLDSQAITKSMKIYICTTQSTQDTSLASYGIAQM